MKILYKQNNILVIKTETLFKKIRTKNTLKINKNVVYQKKKKQKCIWKNSEQLKPKRRKTTRFRR